MGTSIDRILDIAEAVFRPKRKRRGLGSLDESPYAYCAEDGELQIWRDGECIYRRDPEDPWADPWTHNATQVEIARFSATPVLRDLDWMEPGDSIDLEDLYGDL